MSEAGDLEHGETKMGKHLKSEFGHHGHHSSHGNSGGHHGKHFHVDTKDMKSLMDDVSGGHSIGHTHRHSSKSKNKSKDRMRTNRRGVNEYRLGRHAYRNGFDEEMYEGYYNGGDEYPPYDPYHYAGHHEPPYVHRKHYDPYH